MIQAHFQLLAASLIFLLLLIAFWPGYGLHSRWQRLLKQQKHSLLEEVLKQIYECERNRKTCTVNNLAFTLLIKKNKVGTLLKQLEESGLVVVEESSIHLTRSGREQAIHILRLRRILS